MILSGLVAVAALGLAAAQVDDSWDVMADPAQDLLVAGVQFDGGAGLTVQCKAGQLTLALTGMPPTDDATRTFLTTRSDGVERRTVWDTRPGSGVLVSLAPRTARFFRQGGAMTFVSAPGEARPSRMTISLPANPEGIDRVLTACGYATVNARDGIEPVGESLLHTPEVNVPQSVFREHDGFRVELNCLIEAGRLSQCQSDHEAPSDPALGAQLARIADGARVRLSDPAAAEGRMVIVVISVPHYGDKRPR